MSVPRMQPVQAASCTAPSQPTREAIIILDFGSQYSQLIARRVRELRVYCELLPYNVSWERAAALQPKGIILSGGPASVYDEGAPACPDWVFQAGVPVLGICYGAQLIAQHLGGRVERAGKREYGHARVACTGSTNPILDGMPAEFDVWMSHGDHVVELPAGFQVLASSENCPVAAMAGPGGLVGLQFHPEVAHTPLGRRLLENFLYRLCGCTGTWTPASFIEESIAAIRARVGDSRVICALSGGVDSSVAATLVHRAIGDRLTCIFVDNGLLRLNEAEQCIATFRRHLKLNLVAVDARERFLSALRGVTDPEQKRRIIGETFIRVFEAEAQKLGDVRFLVQGTTYPDVIESAGRGTTHALAAAKIKTHHNVGGLPERMRFELIEPLRLLFKDEVRAVGLELGLPEELVWRHPFPGPGLAVRIIGEVTPERLETLRLADHIFISELHAAGLYRQVAQALAVLTPLQTVGVMGDGRTYANVVALRAVSTEDWMTADWSRLPHDFLARVSTRIVNEVPGVNRVVYDITTKPPATVEWE
jgi:GMP synthase (glutamine-hydrolysing)